MHNATARKGCRGFHRVIPPLNGVSKEFLQKHAPPGAKVKSQCSPSDDALLGRNTDASIPFVSDCDHHAVAALYLSLAFVT